MASISLSNVRKNYPKFDLGPIDLEIKDNEFFGVFGPPSCGKTSILKIILGLVSPDEGNVFINGADATDARANERNIAMVFQNLALFPHMTGRDNILFPLRERGVPVEEAEKQLARVSEVLHISHIIDKTPDKMSGGERQRIALGRAFVRDPAGFLLDEPIAALDARLREEMRVELKRLQREGNHTFIYVSHDEEEVLGISDRVAVVEDGCVAQVGTPDEIYDRPSSIYVARIVGSPPMNFIEGRFSTATGEFVSADSHLRIEIAPPHVVDNPRVIDATIGVRPENLAVSRGNSDGTITGTVLSVEPLGSFTIIDVAAFDGAVIKARLPGQITFDDGAEIRLGFPGSAVHLFDADGRRYPAAPAALPEAE
ncbi:ABC transporter ATP-binding protein [Hoeflea sp. TYP-13]|uniref:ABC transporter ATP-binding protein n=1 Tax=Hoeflea sp. TYP-13 TaxID=3230023 RepID=UPI0034C645B4